MPEVTMVYDANDPKHTGPSACCNLIVAGIMSYFFYTYGWDNPDLEKHGNCYARDDSDIGIGINGDGYDNISKQFVTWF